MKSTPTLRFEDDLDPMELDDEYDNDLDDEDEDEEDDDLDEDDDLEEEDDWIADEDEDAPYGGEDDE
jgi:hypothetical protein